jgi:outer membrane lipoprotein carrier protein
MKKLFCIAVLFFAGNAFALKAQQEFLTKIETIKTYKAGFEQIIQDSNGKVISKSKGIMLVKRPNRFYWQTDKPDPIKVIADGKILWLYDIDLEQVTKQGLKKAIQNSPAAILAGDIDEFNSNFAVEHASGKNCLPGKKCYGLKSLDEEPIFSQMILSMDNNKLLEINMTDQMGQKVLTRFSKIKVNENISDNQFMFSPPDDVDVVEMSTD